MPAALRSGGWPGRRCRSGRIRPGPGRVPGRAYPRSELGGPGTGPPGQRPAWTAPAGRPGGPGSAGVAGSAAAAASHTDASGDGSGMTGDATEPLAVVGDPGRALPGQIARFGRTGRPRPDGARVRGAAGARSLRPAAPRRRPDRPAADQRGAARDGHVAGGHHRRSPPCCYCAPGGHRAIRAGRPAAAGPTAAPATTSPAPRRWAPPPRRRHRPELRLAAAYT
jgi:hypothetical protein